MRVTCALYAAACAFALSQVVLTDASEIRNRFVQPRKSMNNTKTGPVPSEYIKKWLIGIKSGSNEEVSALVKRLGGKVTRTMKLTATMAVEMPLQIGNEQENNQILKQLAEHGSVRFVEKDLIRYPNGERTPKGVKQVQSRKAWYDGDNWTAGQYRVVCVVDSGLDRNHEDLAYVSIANTNSYDDWKYQGCNNHGNHVAGTIAATTWNGIGVASVAPYAALYIVRVFDGCQGWVYTSDVTSAAEECFQGGSNIISLSLSGSGESQTERDTFDTLYNDHNILSVAAAGDDGSNELMYPASLDSVISVVATNTANHRASFSNSNEQVELSAPGVDVLSTVTALDGSSSYAYYSGTSMAAAHVSGSAALAWARNPDASASSIRECLQTTAMDLGQEGRDYLFGFGLVQAFDAHRCAMAL